MEKEGEKEMNDTEGRRLAYALNQKGIKQKDLVEELRIRGHKSITDRKMSDYICGRRPIPYKAIWDFAEILGVEAKWLVVGEGRRKEGKK